MILSTYAKSIRSRKQKYVEKGEEKVVGQTVIRVCPHGHKGYAKEKEEAAKKDKVKRLGVEGSIHLCQVLAESVSQVVRQVEDNDRPDSVDAVESLHKRRSRVKNESDHEVEHYDKGVRSDLHASLVKSLKVVLVLDPQFLMHVLSSYRLLLTVLF